MQALDKLVDNAISLSAQDCEIAISLRREEQGLSDLCGQ